ncbi:DUF3331 domain-containing protein [Roseateles terrae]|uniref:DUF3331 domain-containing protein n=1 Tax=Roseateles terrae TaxID=431060 RepID=A0ABR6GU04_9BURK|nr:DUF3331 domain-containing protein [Roseateles terrae]MBB3195600.1 hypothetical protein [Roseateles terrae]
MHSEHKEMAHDGWLRTIAWLGAQSAQSAPGDPSAPGPRSTKSADSGRERLPVAQTAPRAMVRRTVNDGAVHPPARIHVLDRPTPRTAAISWSDPGVCHYGYQIWDMGPARRTGVCVLSGSPIQVGDLVYCPREEEAPVNVGAMIAAAFVDA